jgi:hypothetical protein
MKPKKKCGFCKKPLSQDRHGRRGYCNETCRNSAKKLRERKKNGVPDCVGSEVPCLGCGEMMTKKTENHTCCTRICYDIYSGKNKQVLGSDMTCECCGETITRTSGNQRFCHEKCEPADDFVLVCVRCFEPKLYDDFYDYRGRLGADKLITACRACISAQNLAGYVSKKRMADALEKKELTTKICTN